MHTRLAVPLLPLIMLACSPSKPAPDSPTSSGEVEPASDTSEPTADEPSPADESMVKLTHFETELSVRVGTQLSYSFKSHASVGYGADFNIDQPTLIGHVRTDMAFEHPENQGMPGGDAATGTFVFEALAPGKTTLQVDEVFRGSVETSTVYTITVVEP